MAGEGEEGLLDYYVRELAYLRERGADFANAYPKIAARLGVAGQHCSDPHVERLLESFAYLTGRIQHHLSSELPELTTALLGVLYPQYGSPVPSMAIAGFEIDPAEAKLTSGYTVPKGTALFAESSTGDTCRFRTCYATTLWPVVVKGASVVPPEAVDLPGRMSGVLAAIKMTLKSAAGPFSELGVPRLQFFLSGVGIGPFKLYELLFAHATRVVVMAGKEAYEARLKPVGFGAKEDALPYPPQAHGGYRLLQEYFAFPDKFLFFEIEFDRMPRAESVDILVLLDERPGSSVSVKADTFKLGCTPIINLFPKITEPIRVDHRRPEYRLVADVRRERVTEIHSILEVTATSPGEKEKVSYEPFFSFAHRMEGEEPRAFWHWRRQGTGKKEVPGSDVYLSFVNLDFSPQRPPSDAVYAQVLCTNRDLTDQVDAGSPLFFDQAMPVSKAACLTKPTPQTSAPLGGQALWRLVSNLSLNHLSLTESQNGADVLREILRVYLFTNSPQSERQIMGITNMSCRTVTRRLGGDAWRGFCRGTEVTLKLAEDQFVGSSPVLFGSVLSRFLSLYAHVNTFTELVAKSSTREEVLKRWPPMAGEKVIL